MNELLQQSLADTVSVAVGAKAPDFRLKTENGAEWCLSDNLGKVVALLFYPKDETLICTKQLCSVRDNWEKYLETKAVVVGVSPGTTSQHQKFAIHHNLPMPLLADVDKSITRTYSFHWLLPISLTRAIIVIDAKGIIRTRMVMFGAFRPSDREVLTSIHRARAEEMNTRYENLILDNRK
ncbi:MAG TPA: peroxiredoxin [Pyrinomonadaceae bacterium]|nr:peroxiredoxin [Pyrinomonadaceae bacterium]